MNKWKSVIRIILFAILLLTGCASPSAQQSDAQTVIEVIETNVNPVSYDEVTKMNNCGGKADSEQTVERAFAYSIEGGGTFKVGNGIVEGSINGKYGQYKNITKSQKLVAPPGTNMEFVLRWSEEVYAGNVTVNGEQKPYTVRVPISVEQLSSRDLGGCEGGKPSSPTVVSGAESNPASTTQPIIGSNEPFREHKTTPIVGTGVLAQGTYSDGLANYTEAEVSNHLNIQRIRLEENPDGCSIAYMDADQIWFGSSVKTSLRINEAEVGALNGPTGKHGFVFNVAIHSGEKICVTYFEPSGFMIVFGPDIYYHYDSYCNRGNC